MRQVTVRTVSLLTVTALLGGVGVAGCTNKQKRQAVELVLEAAGVIGVDPFLEHPDIDLRNVNSPSHGGGTMAVDARGTFGGTRGSTRCDKALLIKGITQDPARARAWAGVRNLDPSRIPAYINSLTEVNLEYDTLVKNHNYQGDGRIRGYLSVLQKGVVVLNDPLTGPAVKCTCGNPLTGPDRTVDLKAVTYKGERWETFTSVEITVIAPRPKEKGPVKELQLVDPFESGKAFDRAVGSDGKRDSKEFAWEPPPRPVPSKEPPRIVPPGASDAPPASGSAGSGSQGPGSQGPGSQGPGSQGPGSDGPGTKGPGSGSQGPGSRGPGSPVPPTGGGSSKNPVPPEKGTSPATKQPLEGPKQPSDPPKKPPATSNQPPPDVKPPAGGSKQPPSEPKPPPADPKPPPAQPKQPPAEPKQPPAEQKQPPAQPKQPPAEPKQPPAEQKQPPAEPKQPAGGAPGAQSS
ncbi:hypothetical protein SMD11_0598 [Streptomyces albireticuli]|uniref:DUF6777 domain-containing protein n=1 Tax=Streptomyces albireticuli TaxID=1940 RepID=A0A1Z2KW46_9ACTN|nr:DUF6777 domain-containing protein [Streptomyces albireticuli]ARZ66264.1 hypothetical protein SMD11_0598 [Streptomyces albireticuli]